MFGFGRPGQKRSPPHFGSYNIWQDVTEVFAAADALGWERFSLVGHSRGAVIAALACGTFPERIEHLALIEGIATFISREREAPELLASAYLSLKTQTARHQSVHPSLAAAIAVRVDGKFPVAPSDAQALAARAWNPSKAATPGPTITNCWPILRCVLPSASSMLFARIKQPVHLLIAEQGIIIHHAEVQGWLATQTNIHQSLLPGGHHFTHERKLPGSGRMVAASVKHLSGRVLQEAA